MLQVAHDRVLVRTKVKDKTAAGFAIAGKPQEVKIEQGEVVAVGPGRLSNEGERLPMSVKVGDQIHFLKPYDSADLTDGDDKLTVIMDQNVVAIITQ